MRDWLGFPTDNPTPAVPLQVAQVSKADAAGGGASAVAEMLAGGLPRAGVPALHYALYAEKGFGHRRRPLGGHAGSRLRARQERLKRRFALAEVVPLEAPFLEAELDRFPVDVFHFHDLSSAISPLTLARLSRRVPVVWTLHDCSPFTGGCLYPMGCEKAFRRPGCVGCPQIGTWPLDLPFDTAWLNRRIRVRAHRAPGLHTVSPSRWLAAEARRSGIVPREVRVIPNGIEVDAFASTGREAARDALGIGRGELVIAISAGNLSDPRKNIADARVALREIADADPLVIALGNMTAEVRAALEGLRVLAPGYIADRAVLAQHLAAADAFLFTSLAENHPLAVLEAMAAGAAVLGYATGGVPEQVTEGGTGALVAPGDRAALVAMLHAHLDRPLLARLGAAGRARARREFTVETMIGRYRTLYAELAAARQEAAHA